MGDGSAASVWLGAFAGTVPVFAAGDGGLSAAGWPSGAGFAGPVLFADTVCALPGAAAAGDAAGCPGVVEVGDTARRSGVVEAVGVECAAGAEAAGVTAYVAGAEAAGVAACLAGAEAGGVAACAGVADDGGVAGRAAVVDGGAVAAGGGVGWGVPGRCGASALLAGILLGAGVGLGVPALPAVAGDGVADVGVGLGLCEVSVPFAGVGRAVPGLRGPVEWPPAGTPGGVVCVVPALAAGVPLGAATGSGAVSA